MKHVLLNLKTQESQISLSRELELRDNQFMLRVITLKVLTIDEVYNKCPIQAAQAEV